MRTVPLTNQLLVAGTPVQYFSRMRACARGSVSEIVAPTRKWHPTLFGLDGARELQFRLVVQPIDRVAIRSRDEMAIHIHRRLDRRVAELLLHIVK